MKILSNGCLKGSCVAILLLVSSAAQAHTGHGTSGFAEGIVHPFGLDHLLAMVAVGILSVAALPPGKALLGPMMFMSALIVSAVLGAAGMTVPNLELMISASVALFGAMLIASRSQLPKNAGLALIAVAASLHGLAHGAETPSTGFATYAAGFLLTTAVLHVCGVMAGLSIRRVFATQSNRIISTLGFAFGGAGIYLLSQI